jgi:hypothetical protein
MKGNRATRRAIAEIRNCKALHQNPAAVDVGMEPAVRARIIYRRPAKLAFDTVDGHGCHTNRNGDEDTAGYPGCPLTKQPESNPSEDDPVNEGDHSERETREAVPGVCDKPAHRADDQQCPEIVGNMSGFESRGTLRLAGKLSVDAIKNVGGQTGAFDGSSKPLFGDVLHGGKYIRAM